MGAAPLAAGAWNAEEMLRAARSHGPQALAGTRALQAVLAAVGAEPDDKRLSAINRFFNLRIAFATDLEVWGEQDYWASPLELLGKGRGDCEDYVIGKYFSLIAAGTAPATLRLVYVRATLTQAGRPSTVSAHMVLAYSAQPGDDPLILDNLVADIWPASRRTDLAPVFSFNAEGLWQGVDGRSTGDPRARLSRWRELLAKVHKEGFE